MDSRIWRHLPQGLIDRVLAFLPPPAFFRFRSVCKRWYSLLFSDSFLEAHLRLSPGLPWLAFFLLPPRPPLLYSPSAAGPPPPPAALLLLDPATPAWFRLPLSPLLPRGFSPAASSAGLLCFLSDDPGAKSLLLLNPLSKLSSHLPPSPTPRLFPSVGLAAGPSSLSVVLAGDDLISPFAVKNLTAECFHADGATGFYSPWATASALPRLCNIDPGRMAFAAGRFYCMSCGPFAVLAYDVASNAWCKIQPPMRRFLRSPSLAECGGRVLLVAAVEKSRLSVPRSVRLWSLQPCGRAWAEVERMPQEVYVRFSEAEAGRGFECVGNAEFMAITIKGSTDVLLFDFYRKEWRWAPPCPFIRGAAAGGGLRGFAYEPRLATPAIGLLDSSSSMPFQGFNG
ncbi:protein ABERRANT PANICLE ORGANIZATION 1-like [Phoenix dactylifera]|uniref:Protein ABERRANT PANICLE ORGANIZATION 1-like n=1 Tax=Phoenix dactylifera TaxID=42345 RepID=A0A8B8ZA94_PHODC|nr:protein ABERRANT PANICLE ORGANIZATION 1-like [Phoenix dactylifera]